MRHAIQIQEPEFTAGIIPIPSQNRIELFWIFFLLPAVRFQLPPQIFANYYVPYNEIVSQKVPPMRFEEASR